MNILRCCLLILFAITSLTAADAVERFRSVMKGNDAHDKRTAVQDLAASSANDEVVLPLLVSALADRQARRWAVPALRRRTGLQPSPSEGANTGYPAYPQSDTHGAWQGWLAARQEARREEQTLEEALAAAKQAEAKAQAALDGEQTDAVAGDDPDVAEIGDDQSLAEEVAAEAGGDQGTEVEAPIAEPTDPRGELDRIFFTDGSILRAYILTKRVDLSGKMTSIRIAHRSGGGEETIDASLIARLEEDYQ